MLKAYNIRVIKIRSSLCSSKKVCSKWRYADMHIFYKDMQQIYRTAPMRKFYFNKITLKLYWNPTHFCIGVLLKSCGIFTEHLLPLGDCLWEIKLRITKKIESCGFPAEILLSLLCCVALWSVSIILAIEDYSDHLCNFLIKIFHAEGPTSLTNTNFSVTSTVSDESISLNTHYFLLSCQ